MAASTYLTEFDCTAIMCGPADELRLMAVRPKGAGGLVISADSSKYASEWAEVLKGTDFRAGPQLPTEWQRDDVYVVWDPERAVLPEVLAMVMSSSYAEIASYFSYADEFFQAALLARDRRR